MEAVQEILEKSSNQERTWFSFTFISYEAASIGIESTNKDQTFISSTLWTKDFQTVTEKPRTMKEQPGKGIYPLGGNPTSRNVS